VAEDEEVVAVKDIITCVAQRSGYPPILII
jgi:hypothetical protein